MNPKTTENDLREVGLVIDEPGFKIVENMIYEHLKGLNDLSRLKGNPFDDGACKGEVEGLKYVTRMFEYLRKTLKNKKGDE